MPYDNISRASRNAIRDAYFVKAESDPIDIFISLKNGRDIPVWSESDRLFCKLAEKCSKITTYQERPDLLILNDGGHVLPFVLDFSVTMNGRSTLIGLSLPGRTLHEEEARILKFARAHFALRGAEFVHISNYDLTACDALYSPPVMLGAVKSKASSPGRRHGSRRDDAHPLAAAQMGLPLGAGHLADPR